MPEQVLLTGISGFIAKHVALELLNAGYGVCGTIRTPSRADEVREAVEQAGGDTTLLSFVEADLSSDDGWVKAAQGCTYVQHVASPFPMVQPRDREALVPEARQGALRVLEAARAAGAHRIVLTSSMVAMMYRADRPERMVVTESDWTDPEWDRLSAYIVSKTRAERSAWEWATEHGWKEKLTVINPGLVLGPSLDDRTGTSLDIIKLLLEGAYPAIPRVSFPVVDVRDLARLHVQAMLVPEAGGRRLIGAGEALSLAEMGRILRSEFPDRASRVPKRTLPDFVVRLISNFDRSLKGITPDLGVVPVTESAYVTELTGVTYRPAAEAVRAAARTILAHSAA
ncbi:MAG: aldehyde reductase [Gemmatimonadota bacterium]|nr:aldehyde reductase [Gemmatimonadota bacterium]